MNAQANGKPALRSRVSLSVQLERDFSRYPPCLQANKLSARVENLLLDSSVSLNVPLACNFSRYPLACGLKSERPSKWQTHPSLSCLLKRDFSRYPPCLKANKWYAWMANPLLALPSRYACHSCVTSHDIPPPCGLKTHQILHTIIQSVFRFNTDQSFFIRTTTPDTDRCHSMLSTPYQCVHGVFLCLTMGLSVAA